MGNTGGHRADPDEMDSIYYGSDWGDCMSKYNDCEYEKCSDNYDDPYFTVPTPAPVIKDPDTRLTGIANCLTGLGEETWGDKMADAQENEANKGN